MLYFQVFSNLKTNLSLLHTELATKIEGLKVKVNF